MSTATENTTAPAAAAAAPADNVDLSSVLSKLAQLEKENKTLHAEMQKTRQKFGKLQSEKVKEMEQMMDTVIKNWIDNLSGCDEDSKKQLTTGLQSLVTDGNETGVWNVIACASSNFQNSVNQIEKLTEEVNSLRKMKEEMNEGHFASEESRISGVKRPAEEMAENEPRDVWSELQDLMMREGVNSDRVY